MKKITNIIIFTWFLILSCNENPKSNANAAYPFLVTKLGVQLFYDIAAKEMYKINTCCDCNCMARGIIKHGIDTVNIINLDLKLENLVSRNDTLTFIFSFYSIVEKDTIYYSPFSQSWTSCLYNGISFKGDNPTPFPLSYGDTQISNLAPKFNEEASINFEKCIKNNTVSSTLKKVLGEK